MLTGSDEWRWVAYCFVDTYFDEGDEARESVESYHNESLLKEGMRVDPLTYGNVPADDPIRTPREYFLVVFQNRIAQVKREWQRVVQKVQQSFRDYEQVRLNFLMSMWVPRARWVYIEGVRDLALSKCQSSPSRNKHLLWHCSIQAVLLTSSKDR